MGKFTENKIEETYNIALKLGIEEKASVVEKKIFKDMLYRIAMSASDEARANINEMLHKESNEYTNHN